VLLQRPSTIDDDNVSMPPSQRFKDTRDHVQLQRETILVTHFQNDDGPGEKGFSSEYIDSLLAKEFTSLTVQERSKTYEEIHGVSDCVDETPTFVESCLLQQISIRHGRATEQGIRDR